MKQAIYLFVILAMVLAITTSCADQRNSEQPRSSQQNIEAEAANQSPSEYHSSKATDKLYVIERDMPGVGKLTPAELRKASQISNGVLSDLGPEIKWIHSYVTDNKIYCVYSSPNEELVRQHAVAAGFPANVISEAGTIIDPSTGY
jgi:hypothetical protein